MITLTKCLNAMTLKNVPEQEKKILTEQSIVCTYILLELI
jgi:hypothetical protein